MRITLEEMNAINQVQLNIFKEFVKVCSELGLQYYMVHGSLLGTVRYHGFFPYDDDIDVAMPRKDYDKLIAEGASLFPEPLFLQSCITEQRYPLQFAKLRNSHTAFIQPEMTMFNVNQGIYIDIFPIDYYPNNKIIIYHKRFLEYVYNARICKDIQFEQKQPIWKVLLRKLSILFCPSLKRAVEKRAFLYVNNDCSSKVITVGGKILERGIPNEWFGKGIMLPFEDMQVCCPAQYKEYLSCIYGDYLNYNPAQKYMNADNTVTISANKISFDIPYYEFIK